MHLDFIRQLQKKNKKIEDVEKAITLTPSKKSEFDQEFKNTELILEPKAKTSTMSDEEQRFLILCQKVMRKLGLVRNVYEFSEQFMGKSKHYYSMLLSENRQCSIDGLHNLIKNIEALNEMNHNQYLDKLYTDGQQILTKRLLKYF